MDDASVYYFRFFATNNNGQPASENTFYSNVATAETLWNAFTFTFEPSYAADFGITSKSQLDNNNLFIGRIIKGSSTNIHNIGQGINLSTFTDYGNVGIRYRATQGDLQQVFAFSPVGVHSVNPAYLDQYYECLLNSL